MIKRTLIIAEAGVNHNGDLGLAKRLIDAAAEAGADLVKFQTFNASRLVTRGAKKAAYQTQTTDGKESQHDMLQRLELTEAMHRELIAHCAARSIGFFSTGFDIESIDLLLGLGQDHFKIPSGEITNLPYLRHIGQLGKKTILSTGMATLGEIEAAIDVLEQAGTPRTSITVLHCTTEYPTPMAEVNLRAMQSIQAAFGVAVGYSDHTQGIEVAIAAVAMGATVIEKHFTLDRTLPGPDHQASLEPAELKAMVVAIRNIEAALGDGIKKLTPSEARNKPVARKSLVTSQAIKAGEVINAQNITAKRPGTGISPMLWDEVIGRRAPRDFAADELVEL
ncbi:N-acetylneuraminate synthase [Rhodoferax sp.]|uniref:N-acetylneuraminate synthase n=1 Tax=Rhodoferax sp. TaxID=50421 RepID=UPI0008C9494C|nr:N-acetylneuraminate synthase [Rhodoferax sp.]MDO8319251.1 N-acetylneuraminate synthase [Rhodoferax sp.]MDP2680616.1 N-acetylneuraminate synthase [Rhodoferax sp.]OGB50077.1 MAG: N-acetylneuraminate synthase [Burkholderiales bacterium RIFOXYD12_FULL_59_19]OGB76995.1 MAG: N-acetylneuraminate synthase [Burkholderiales bacterium RIFOXYC12_FULL_60_6]